MSQTATGTIGYVYDATLLFNTDYYVIGKLAASDVTYTYNAATPVLTPGGGVTVDSVLTLAGGTTINGGSALYSVGATIAPFGGGQLPPDNGKQVYVFDGPGNGNVFIWSNIALSPSDLFAKSDGPTVDFTPEPLCFLRGTNILTPTGEVPVEALNIGDLLVTRFNGIQPVKWIGRQSYAARFVQNNPDMLPVRIRAHALGEKFPLRDLYVSPGHSMLIGGSLILARCLVNGITITQGPAPERIDYFSIELETHDCVIAESAFAETFADGPGLRAQFHNAVAYFALYPDSPPPDEILLCAPRPERGAKLDAALRTVVARAACAAAPGPLEGCIDSVTEWRVEGWALDCDNPDLPTLLEIVLNGDVIGTALACDFRGDLKAAGKGNGRCAFFYKSQTRLPAALLPQLYIRRAADGAEIRTRYAPEAGQENRLPATIRAAA